MRRAGSLVEQQGLHSLAICFLHSYADPTHEQRAAELLRQAYPNVSVSISSDTTREYREYERTSTVALDAYIGPVLRDYLAALEHSLSEAGMTRSMYHAVGWRRDDGCPRAPGPADDRSLRTRGRRSSVRAQLAPPSAVGREWVLCFDVGGTSAGRLRDRGRQRRARGCARPRSGRLLHCSSRYFDIRTVGAGGGSIPVLGRRRPAPSVGPRSAGAVCLRTGPLTGAGGTEPTMTDAALALGYLDAKTFLAGGMNIDTEAAQVAVGGKSLAEPLGHRRSDTPRSASSAC